MAQITLPIGGANYVVGCQDGEEEHLKHLAQEVERRLAKVRENLSPAGEGHALFLTTLLLADEIYDLEHGKMSKEAEKVLKRAEATLDENKRYHTRLAQAADIAEHLAQRVEKHSETLEGDKADTSAHSE
ncbi:MULTISPECIES: cell division protein ZapA [unclassified Saccharibacter]|uniref:cell division protein ZapA n=1 Tax=unclassified Saccharibacter TaxID=2648722 RepID=UPI00132CB930|nr:MULTISPECIES: cell division protein ZapA [unclassified Saccharibacter]MXV34950.1 cell division protein ZapA [Saccharibacter sp. EH611]MXV57504.1 cell division protein ZapA [Saccharibacter sp. EH70]MXV64635.1 cell division protein ZapA [Saccharibacter sp. EH60]